ncbi:membrane transporter [Raphidocelis subcapitata]|uniref:Membrane transporter n=1 Tax=Raphidocelis subcapitata TaxID=307507 RepID=A0A2V0NP30_9CHLO|nr:membrane transporter [Raphidocelis subcapitata]|eukprot:GBF89354.1 membrane transporter [Raphidocelis subcapitata]
MANRAWTGAFWALWALLLLSWVLALAGLAALQNNCYSSPEAALGAVAGVHGFTNSLDCSSLYRLYWWLLAFVFALLVGVAVAAGTGWLVASSLSWALWSAVLSALFVMAGDSFLSLRDVSAAGTGIWWSRASTAAAGFILCAIFLLGLTFLLGWRQRRAAPGGGGGGAGPIKY